MSDTSGPQTGHPLPPHLAMETARVRARMARLQAAAESHIRGLTVLAAVDDGNPFRDPCPAPSGWQETAHESVRRLVARGTDHSTRGVHR